MTIVRHFPGDEAPWSGTYALVGHYGEETGVTVRRLAGERLPFVVVTNVEQPVWYVLSDVPASAVQAA